MTNEYTQKHNPLMEVVSLYIIAVVHKINLDTPSVWQRQLPLCKILKKIYTATFLYSLGLMYMHFSQKKYSKHRQW